MKWNYMDEINFQKQIHYKGKLTYFQINPITWMNLCS